jgi:hypothetical protein
VEQVIDVREDPGAKGRVLNGMVNVAVCPQCGTGGALNMPFMYHDPENDLALVYMPMEAGRDDLERQQAIGKFTQQVMDDLPPEERKAYLLQPEVFFTLENLTKRIFEVEGITEEMIEEQKAKADLLRRMLEATSDDVLEALIKENDERIDADVFRLLSMNLQMAQSAGQTADVQRMLNLQEKLIELTDEGQKIQARNEALETLREDPTRENLVELVVNAPDEETRQILIVYGRPLVDYRFFQTLSARIEATDDEEEKQRLTDIRKEILELREELDEQARAVFNARGELLRDLLLSDEPEQLARQRFQELDEAFLQVLTANLEEAQAAGQQEIVEDLEEIWRLTVSLIQETVPPALRLFTRLMEAEEDEIESILEQNQELVTEDLIQFLEAAQGDMEEEGEEEALQHLQVVLEKARERVN